MANEKRLATGLKGMTGTTGARGVTGARGPAGRRGPIGPSVTKADILAVVDDQFKMLRKQLETQLTRTGQIQQQLDQIHLLVKGLVEQS